MDDTERQGWLPAGRQPLDLPTGTETSLEAAAGEIAVEGRTDGSEGVLDGDELRSVLADRASRAYWEAEADSYQAEHGSFLGAEGSGFVWGPEGWTEEQLGLLGPPGRRRVLEVGAGAGQCATWLAERGDSVAATDISVAQLRHAPRRALPTAASAVHLPFADQVFDVAFSSYGALQFVHSAGHLFAEVARVLKPGGRWVFSLTHPIRWAFPDVPDEFGLTAVYSYFDRTPYVERDDDGIPIYVEHHRTISDLVRALLGAGFVIEDLVEPEWPETNDKVWGGWSPLRGSLIPGTMIFVSRRTVPSAL
jgi:SAM-dependent methyltransferase